jgi:hypothetical protein
MDPKTVIVPMFFDLSKLADATRPISRETPIILRLYE